MFAGDNFKPAADASYRNFDAGPSFSIRSNVRKNNEIGTIDSWGPLFRISLDLIIHSQDGGRSSVLTFQSKEATTKNEKITGLYVERR